MGLWRSTQAPVFILLGLSLGVSGCASEGGFGPSSGSQNANLGLGQDYDANEAELAVHDQVNDYRVDAEVETLDFENLAGAAARAHSENMAEGSVELGHSGFDDRADEVLSQIDNATSVGENVGRVTGAETQADAVEAMLAYWQESPEHDENLLHEDWSLAGVGVAQSGGDTWYFTQMYVGMR